MTDREELTHIINGTDMLPVLVPEIAKLLREQLGGWHYIRPDHISGEIEIIVCKRNSTRTI